MQTIKAKKSLGQNFLIDQEALTDIAGSIELSGRHIIEVGPGYGALTEHIVAANPKSLDLVELDTDMVKILVDRYYLSEDNLRHREEGNEVKGHGDPGIWIASQARNDETKITLHHQDVLTFTPIYDEYSVIANIPYYITSPILFHFLYPETLFIKRDVTKGQGDFASENTEQNPLPPSSASPLQRRFAPPKEMTIMMQKEVGEKILEGRAKKPHHSFLSLAMELACEDIEIVRYVGKESFDPAPKIDSIVLKFIVKQTRNPEIEKKLINLWKIAFTHPRKTLLSNLKGSHYDIEDIRKTLIELGYDERVRAEAVKMEDWNYFL